TLAIPSDVAKALGLKTVQASSATRPTTLPPLNGVLALDSNRLARVHARFTGEVVALGTVQGSETVVADVDTSADRALRHGDSVKKGQLLAVVWSKDLGEKKSELIDALSRLRLDQRVLERLRGAPPEAVPERSLREAERTVEG